MKKIISSFVLIGSFIIAKAQSPINMISNENYIRGNYLQTLDNGDVDFTYKTIHANLYKMYSMGEISIGMVYESQNYIFKDNQESKIFEAFEYSHKISISSTFSKDFKKGWKLILTASPQINTTFKSALTFDDFIMGGYIHVSKNHFNNPGEFSFGLNYDTSFGSPKAYPFVSYTYRIDRFWEYTLGFPISSIDYTLNDHQNISLLVGPQGDYINNPEVISINGTKTYRNSKLEFQSLNIGLDYNLKFSDSWTMNLGLAYVTGSDLKILDSNNHELYSFNITETMSINFGIKLNLNKNK